jgi:hypothetical protein
MAVRRGSLERRGVRTVQAAISSADYTSDRDIGAQRQRSHQGRALAVMVNGLPNVRPCCFCAQFAIIVDDQLTTRFYS